MGNPEFQGTVADMSEVLARLTVARALNLDNLDSKVSLAKAASVVDNVFDDSLAAAASVVITEDGLCTVGAETMTSLYRQMLMNGTWYNTGNSTYGVKDVCKANVIRYQNGSGVAMRVRVDKLKVV